MVFYSNQQEPPIGYIRVSHDTTKSICKLAIKNINETQKKNQAKYVEKIRQGMNHPWWTFGYRTKEFTTEDAINKIENEQKHGSVCQSLSHLYKYPDATGFDEQQDAKEILEALDDTQLELTINIQKWNSIKRWTKT